MNLYQYVDLYCERTAVGLLAEPFNLFSNLFFVLAGLVLLVKHSERKYATEKTVYAILVITVGLGSSLFHAVATVWGQWADVVPIALLVFYYIYVFSSKIAGFSFKGTFLLFAVLFLSSLGLSKLFPAEMLNNSTSYLGVLFTMMVMAAIDLKFLKRKTLLIATAIFAVSLTFRTLDQSFCAQYPIGLHFLWHTLNGCMLYVLGSRFVRKP